MNENDIFNMYMTLFLMLFRAIIIYTSLELLTEKRNNTNYNNNTLNTIDIIKNSIYKNKYFNIP